MKERLKDILDDLRLLVLFPKRYGARGTHTPAYWRGMAQAYGDMEKRLLSSGYRWRVITYDDGHQELAYIRVLRGGMLSGKFPAIYRGLFLPRRIGLETFSRIKDTRLAF